MDAGLAFVHAGERIIPAGDTFTSAPTIVIERGAIVTSGVVNEQELAEQMVALIVQRTRTENTPFVLQGRN